MVLTNWVWLIAWSGAEGSRPCVFEILIHPEACLLFPLPTLIDGKLLAAFSFPVISTQVPQ